MIKKIVNHIQEFINVIGKSAVVIDSESRIMAVNDKYIEMFPNANRLAGAEWEAFADYEYTIIPLQIEEAKTVYKCYVCDGNIKKQAVEKKRREELAVALEEALCDGEFIPYFQPKMNSLTNKIYGAEALVRWISSKWGFIIPGKFIPLAEKNGFIKEIDFAILEQVCKVKKRWEEEQAAYKNIVISVNMSRIHFFEYDFVERIVEITQQYGISPSEIDLEITEGIFFEDIAMIKDTIANLKAHGFLISIDDFGSGYSSLGMLKDVEVDILKLDKTFVESAGVNARGLTIIRNVIAMAKDLKMTIIAEGVETEEQKHMLTKHGCEIIQGYYYSKPLPIDEFEVYVQENWAETNWEMYFPLRDNVIDKNHQICADSIGKDIVFADGAMNLPGGPEMQNVVTFPHEVLISTSYTISMWIYQETQQTWSSIFFIRYDKGFMSIVPLSIGNRAMFRICDDRSDNGWHDLVCSPFPVKEWVHVAVTYDAKNEVARLYLNGVLIQYLEHIPPLNGVEKIVAGGDYYQKSFHGKIKDLVIISAAESSERITQLYMMGKENL